MSQKQAYQKDIESIRQIMERSVKFLSLSGLSGILAGVYALLGAAIAFSIIYKQQAPFDFYDHADKEDNIISRLLIIAISVLIVSLITGYVLATKKAKKLGLKFWDTTSKRLIVNLGMPLLSGGIFILILLTNGHYGIAVPACLIFYGLALINASQNLFDEVRYLGYCEIVLGLVCAMFPGFGLFFWAIGFGALHIVYGALMFKKYDQ